ncbi:hypothetical protein ACKXK4_004731 [Escherichia coli]
MSRELTLEQAAERAHQTEIIARLVEDFPHHLADSEVSAIATLLKRLSGDVTAWLIEEIGRTGGEAMKQGLSVSEVMCRIQQAQTVLTMWLHTMTTDDGEAPDMVDAVLTILDGLADALAVESDK